MNLPSTGRSVSNRCSIVCFVSAGSIVLWVLLLALVDVLFPRIIKEGLANAVWILAGSTSLVAMFAAMLRGERLWRWALGVGTAVFLLFWAAVHYNFLAHCDL